MNVSKNVFIFLIENVLFIYETYKQWRAQCVNMIVVLIYMRLIFNNIKPSLLKQNRMEFLFVVSNGKIEF